MSSPLKRFGDLQIVAVYNTVEKLASLRNEWTQYVKQGSTFCPSGACPFVPGDKFEYDLTNFLYYRARAITADVCNQNGDLFEHPEIKQAYHTFVGKGVYFNHDSDNPDKAFGIILDAMYTPVLFGDDSYEDKYVEILAAIDRNAIEEKRPGLLKDIESGRVTSTSMGTIAKRAKCSICGNVATNMETLCFVPGTGITMADGSVIPIEEVVVGDSVIDHTGTSRKVTAVFSRDVDEDVYDIKFEGLQFPITCTGSHPIFALKNAAGKTKRRGSVLLPPDFIHAHELAAGDFGYSPIPKFDIANELSVDKSEWRGRYAVGEYIEVGSRPSAVGFSLHKGGTAFAARLRDLGVHMFAVGAEEYINGGSRAIRPNKKNAALHAIPYADGYIREIKSISRRKYTGKVHNLEVAESHSYVANGVAVHNCDHVHPQSPLYMKGRNVYGKKCYETNYGLTFIEDSIVYVPADPTAHMLEVYASKRGGQLDRLAEVFLKYSRALGRKITSNPVELTSNFKTTGGLLMEKTAATSEFKHTKDPSQHLVAPYQETIKELDSEVTDSAAKTLDNKIRRLIEEEFRKALAPLLEHMDKVLRPTIKDKVTEEVSKVKEELGEILPGGVEAINKAIAEAPELKDEPAKQPPAVDKPAAPAAAPKPATSTATPKPAAPKPTAPASKPALAPAAASVKIAYIENFANWTAEQKAKLAEAIAKDACYEFTGTLEMPEPPENK